MSEKKHYVVEGFDGEFDFSPDGSPLVGVLSVTVEEQTFGSQVNLEKLGSRAHWAREAAELYPKVFSAPALKRALNELHILRTEEVEAASENVDAGEPDKDEYAPEPKSERYETALALLESPRLLARLAVDMKKLGHVGEYANKRLAFICGISAKAGMPIQPATHAQSSAGKNELWNVTLSLFPEEMVIRRSGLTAKALFRTTANLKGAVLYIQEISGS